MQKNVFKIYDGRNNFWQWDKKQKLIVLDDEVTEVHFSNRNMTHSIKRNVNLAEKQKKTVNVSFELPKSFVVVKENGEQKIYISQLSSQTLEKRSKSKKIFYE